MTSDINVKAKFYQNVGLWPRTSKLNYKGWLSNFDNENDLELAKMILNFFVYYSDDLVDQLIIAAVGKCGYKLQELNGSWDYEDFKKKLAKLDDDSKEDDENIRQYVMDIVPTYHPNKE